MRQKLIRSDPRGPIRNKIAFLPREFFTRLKGQCIPFSPHHQGTELALFTRSFDCRDACD
ncbi:MAG TPA: hypothetical protein DCO65_09300 [Spartobacteria bacterium]|nr:hypothetical protein [Spartobacteria bacterium]